MSMIIEISTTFWHLLLDAAPYMLIGIVVAGLLKSYLSTDFVAQHLGGGRFMPVFKAALLGVPIPLCSCGVLPAAAGLKKQGASKGATVAFMISTPESGIDSISVSYALLDPLMTVARPVAAFFSAITAGILETLLGEDSARRNCATLTYSPACGCDEISCTDSQHPPTSPPGMLKGLRYAFSEIWGDMAGWFTLGLVLSGIITTMIPDDLVAVHLGGGLQAMLIMLAIGIPIYICASASTPIAAALLLKGVSPGAALVFLLAGPATNLASLGVLTRMLGLKGVIRYLSSLAITSVAAGLILDLIYVRYDISAQAVVGQAGEIFPYPVQLASAILLMIVSIKPIGQSLIRLAVRLGINRSPVSTSSNCGCSGKNCSI